MAASGGKGGTGHASNAALAVDEPMVVRRKNFAEWKKKRGPYPNSNMPTKKVVVDSK